MLLEEYLGFEGWEYRAGELKVKFLWSDSIGAKSSSMLVETPDVKVLVDPGASEMQPGYPLSYDEKLALEGKALELIVESSRKADVVVVTHYHYDHHVVPRNSLNPYVGKTLLVKNPNVYVNESQWNRARFFLERLLESIGGSLEEHLEEPKSVEVRDPMDELPIASSKDFGDYQKRREELLEKGRKWFEKLVRKWTKEAWVGEIGMENLEVQFADGREFAFGRTKLRFTKPMFHGLEFERLGWVVGLVVEHGSSKLFYSSDIQGPIIEDYAVAIIEEAPDIVVLDGPPTYLYGYMLNKTNLRRAIENAVRIVEEADFEIMVYDHHLAREARFKERLKDVYLAAQKASKRVCTLAEHAGMKPLILKVAESKQGG